MSIPLPPEEFIRAVGDGDFRAVGDHLFDLLVQHGKLLPHHHVLDLGSGCGRLAVPLAAYLDDQGSYAGIDISELMIDWCRREITQRHPRFRFVHADVTNTSYRPHGAKAEEYAFPFIDETFDLVTATSLFTHLVPRSALRYLRETARVLKHGGRVVFTFFVLVPTQSKETMQLDLSKPFERCKVMDASNPEAAIAYPIDYVISLFADAGLSLDTISLGGWSGHRGWSWQDVIVATRG